jgi:LEA14-like dessication related protein
MNFLPLLLIGAAVFAFTRNAKNLSDQLEYNLSSLKVDKSKTTLSTIVGTLSISIFNPTSTAFSFKGVQAAALYKANKIANIFWQQDVKVLANNTTTITIPFRIPVAGAAQALTDAILNYGEGIEIKLSGKILFTAGSLNIDKTVKLL